jgi:uncharacterized protein (DUF2147 family)
MKKLFASALFALFAANVAFAQAPAAPAAAPAEASCEAKAIDKNGKPLAGAAKASFIKKCEADTGANACATKAVDKNGKPLAGAAKTSFMKKCEADAAK